MGFKPANGVQTSHWGSNQPLGFKPATGVQASHWGSNQPLGFKRQHDPDGRSDSDTDPDRFETLTDLKP
eukprot:364001-Chlamydomonas_euryale.AAC.7